MVFNSRATTKQRHHILWRFLEIAEYPELLVHISAQWFREEFAAAASLKS